MNTIKKIFASFSLFAVLFATVAAPVANAQLSDLPGHWSEEFVNPLVDQGVINGYPDGTYRPDNPINRAELVKIVVEATDGILADLVPATPTFTDVGSGAWFYEYVETAYATDVVGGYTAEACAGAGLTWPCFKPGDNITREQAMKVIILGFGVPTDLDPAPNFIDVTVADWSYDYVTTAANHCIINNTQRFNPRDNITRGEVAKIILNAMKVVDGEDLCEPPVSGDTCENDDDCTADERCAVELSEPVCVPLEGCTSDADCDGDLICNTGTGECISETTDAILEVSLSGDNPVGKTIPYNGNNIAFLTLDMSVNAGASEAVEVNTLTVSLTGLGDVDNIDEVKVFDENAVNQYGSGRGFSSATNTAALNLQADPIVIEPGMTETVIVAADLDPSVTYDDVNNQVLATGDEHLFSISTVSDIRAFGETSGGVATVTGSFPASGNTMTIGGVGVGTIDFEEKSTTDNTVEIGEMQKTITRFEIEVGSEEDVLVKAITFEQTGTVSSEDIANVTMWFGDTKLGETAQVEGNDRVTIDLTGMDQGGWLIEDGASRNVELRADVINGIADTVAFEIDEPQSDVIAEGQKYGFNVNAGDWCNGTAGTKANGVTSCGGVDTGEVTIEGGDLNFAFASTAKDASPDSQDVLFGTLTIINAGEPVTIEEMDLLAIADDFDTGADNVEANTCVLDNIKLSGVDSAITVGPEDAGISSGTETITFKDDFFIDAGETVTLNLTADIDNATDCDNATTGDQGIGDGDKYRFEISMTSVQYRGETSGDDFACGPNTNCTPSNNPFTQDVTISQSAVVFTGNPIAAQTHVARSQQVALWKGTVRASNAEDIVIRSLVFEQNTTDDPNNIENLAVYTQETPTSEPVLKQSGESIVTASNRVTFSSMDEDSVSGIRLNAGQEKIIWLFGDVAATLNDSDASGDVTTSFDLLLDPAEPSTVPVVENVDGDTADVNNTANIAANTLTLEQSGGLTVTYDVAESPDPQLLIGGEQDVEIATFEFDAENEHVRVNDLTVLINELDTSGILNGYDYDPVAGTNTLVNGIDVPNDADAISSISLFYADGTPVLQKNDLNATTTSIDGDKARLTNLELLIDKDDNELISVYVNTNQVAETAVGESGMAFNAALSFNEGNQDEFDINGESSGTAYLEVGATIGADDDTDGIATQIVVDDSTQGAEVTNIGENFFLFNNRLTAAKAASQATALTNGNVDALRFVLQPSGDGTSYLHKIYPTVSISGLTAAPTVHLYSGSTKLADCNNIAVSEFECDVTVGGTVDPDPISKGGETYTIRLEGVALDGAVDDSVTTRLDINTDELTSNADDGTGEDDDILWEDDGVDGVASMFIDWIDLHPDTVKTSVEHTLQD
jgi:hypothetical protein